MYKIAFSSHFASLLDFTVPNLLQRLGDASAFENFEVDFIRVSYVRLDDVHYAGILSSGNSFPTRHGASMC